MIIKEVVSQIWEDEKRTKPLIVKSFEISGVTWPKEKNFPAALILSGCPAIYMCASNMAADVFVAFQISFKAYLKLKWRRMFA